MLDLNLKSKSKEQFIPLKDFLDHMPYARTFPYASRLSFEPLMEYLEQHAQHKGPILRGLFKNMHQQLEALQARVDVGEPLDGAEAESTMQDLMALCFPLNAQKEGKAFAGKPFTHSFTFQSTAVKEQYADENLEIFYPGTDDDLSESSAIAEMGWLILETCYGYTVDYRFPNVFRMRNRKTGMEKYYRVDIITDFLRVKTLSPPPELQPSQVKQLLENVLDRGLWLRYLPPENFVLEGIVLGYLVDVTESEAWSNLQQGLIGESPREKEGMIEFVQAQFRSFLQEPELRLGAVPIWWESSAAKILESSLLRPVSEELEFLPTQIEGSIYHRLVEEGKPIVIEDLRQETNSAPCTMLMNQGFRSLILAPVKDEEGTIIGVLEIGSPQPGRFNALTLLKLQDVFTLFSVSLNRMKREMQDTVQLAIQKRYTSIHQSVFWKFRAAAEQMLFSGKNTDEAIAFKDVYPLYGQADIVSSSTLRSEAIHADILANLEMLAQALKICVENSDFHLLDSYLSKVNQLHRRLSREFYSSDENEVADLLIHEIHPFLRYLEQHNTQLREQALQPYFAEMDNQLGILYRRRKDYEKSVEMLNVLLGNFMEEQQQKMQNLLPHYYEVYKTDGIEYNIYLGQSILQHGQFLDYHLKDFRLWQLVSMCEATRLVEREGQRLPTPLSTAQLIFVYNNPISIRFRMDDKRFDVDGAYNVRYEIIKKRIDKAIVKGSGERLTQRGKVAIVYLNEKDLQEYQSYIDYLIDKQYITEEVEYLELDRLQGADGLKAVRLKVV